MLLPPFFSKPRAWANFDYIPPLEGASKGCPPHQVSRGPCELVCWTRKKSFLLLLLLLSSIRCPVSSLPAAAVASIPVRPRGHGLLHAERTWSNLGSTRTCTFAHGIWTNDLQSLGDRRRRRRHDRGQAAKADQPARVRRCRGIVACRHVAVLRPNHLQGCIVQASSQASTGQRLRVRLGRTAATAQGPPFMLATSSYKYAGTRNTSGMPVLESGGVDPSSSRMPNAAEARP